MNKLSKSDSWKISDTIKTIDKYTLLSADKSAMQLQNILK